MGSNGVPLGSIIGGLPLVNEPLIIGSFFVPAVDSSADFPVVEADAPTESSEIIDLDTVLLEEVNDLLTLGIGGLEDFDLLLPGVVAAVADRAGVVVGLPPGEQHCVGYVI